VLLLIPDTSPLTLNPVEMKDDDYSKVMATHPKIINILILVSAICKEKI